MILTLLYGNTTEKTTIILTLLYGNTTLTLTKLQRNDFNSEHATWKHYPNL